MALKIVIRPLAETDLDDAISWHNEQKENLWERFLFEFREILTILSFHPYAFRKRYKHVRAFGLKRFPYKIYYLIDGSTIHVLAVIHQKRSSKGLEAKSQ